MKSRFKWRVCWKKELCATFIYISRLPLKSLNSFYCLLKGKTAKFMYCRNSWKLDNSKKNRGTAHFFLILKHANVHGRKHSFDSINCFQLLNMHVYDWLHMVLGNSDHHVEHVSSTRQNVGPSTESRVLNATEHAESVRIYVSQVLKMVQIEKVFAS